jgi:serine/threonine protein kinase
VRLQRQSNGQLITIDPALALGTGGEARVYAIPQEPSLVAKVYHEPTGDRASKLMAMLANPPDDPLAVREHVAIAWPVDLLLTTDRRYQCVGFLMPRMSGMHPIADVYNPRARRQKHPWFDYFRLHHTARNLAAAVHALHTRGYVIADVKPSNIFVTDTALVALVDTDSFQVRDARRGIVYRCPVSTPEVTPPELQGQRPTDIDRAPEHDLFGVAVIIFQLLMEGTHPFDGLFQGSGDPPPYEARIAAGHFPYSGGRRVPFRPKPSAPPFEILHPTLQQLFRHCFEDGHYQPKARPDALAWRFALDEAEDHLITCPVSDQHRYGDHLSACPWCKRAGQLGGYDPFPSRQTGQRGQHAPSPVPKPTPRSPLRSPRQQARLLQTFTKGPTSTPQAPRPQRPNGGARAARLWTRLASILGRRLGAGLLARWGGVLGWRRALSSAGYGTGLIATAMGLAGMLMLMRGLPQPSPGELPPHRLRWPPLEASYQAPAGEPFVFPLPPLAHTPAGRPVDVTLEASGDEPSWLQLDRERLSIGGTAPFAAEDRTYRLMIRAHAAQGGDGRWLVWLRIIGQPARRPVTPQLPGHWTW